MSAIKIAGVMRAEAFSPNHIDNDAVIFNCVADHLRRHGCEVTLITEVEFQNETPSQPVIINMCRERSSVLKLQTLQDEGRLVINSGYGIENCTREKMTRMFLRNNIPVPDSIIVNTDENIVPLLWRNNLTSCWIKRGDHHSIHKEDVSFSKDVEETQELLHEFFCRGINKAVINRHLEGDLVKFYGVKDTTFFYWFYPYECGHSKFGIELINEPVKHFSFDEKKLEFLCSKAASILDVMIYGGDCIIEEDGNISIIDFNDWPSFAPCRNEVAPVIAKAIISEIKKSVLC